MTSLLESYVYFSSVLRFSLFHCFCLFCLLAIFKEEQNVCYILYFFFLTNFFLIKQDINEDSEQLLFVPSGNQAMPELKIFRSDMSSKVSCLFMFRINSPKDGHVHEKLPLVMHELFSISLSKFVAESLLKQFEDRFTFSFLRVFHCFTFSAQIFWFEPNLSNFICLIIRVQYILHF